MTITMQCSKSYYIRTIVISHIFEFFIQVLVILCNGTPILISIIATIRIQQFKTGNQAFLPEVHKYKNRWMSYSVSTAKIIKCMQKICHCPHKCIIGKREINNCNMSLFMSQRITILWYIVIIKCNLVADSRLFQIITFYQHYVNVLQHFVNTSLHNLLLSINTT